MQKHSLVGLASLSFLFPLFAVAEPDEEVPTVYVSATRSAQSTVTTPALISIISQDEIAASGAGHLVEVLEAQAGIQLQDLFGDGSRTKISMRGFGADNSAANVLVLVDGRRLNHTDLSAPDLNSISLKDVEQIEIIEGSAGTLYGDQAVGGVINIITRQPKKFSAEAKLATGSYNTKIAQANMGNRTDSGVAYRISAEQKATNNYRDYNTQDYKNLSAVTHIPVLDGKLGLDYQYVEEYLQLPGALSAAQLAADRQQAASTTDFNDSATKIARATFQKPVSKNWNIETELTNRQAEGSGALYAADFDQQRNHWGLTPRLVGTLPGAAGDTLVTLGIDIDQTDYAYRVPSWFIDTASQQTKKALYAQGIKPLRDNLELTLGVRHAHSTDNITDASAFPTGVTLDKSATVTEIGIAQKMADWRLFARRDENIRFAKTDEHTFTETGVTGLDPQTGVSYEFGAQWKKGGQRFNAMIYQLDLDNEIDFDGTADGPWGPGTGANVNLDPTRRLGLKLDGRLQLASRAHLETQYAFIDAVFRGGPYSGNTIPFVARHNLTLKLNWKPKAGWNVFAESRSTSERYQGGDYDNLYPKLSAMTLINLGASYRRDRWQLLMRINNLGDIKYNGYALFDSYYPAPTRNYTISAKYNLR